MRPRLPAGLGGGSTQAEAIVRPQSHTDETLQGEDPRPHRTQGAKSYTLFPKETWDWEAARLLISASCRWRMDAKLFSQSP